MTTEPETALLPCPFCGCEVYQSGEFAEHPESGCTLSTGLTRIAAWNSRPAASRGDGVEAEVERVARAMYDDHPFTVIHEALAIATGLPLGATISWEKSVEAGADHSGLRRLARAALTTLREDASEDWTCRARKQSLPEPADCNWPVCGCDPYADKVIASLEESGATLREDGWRDIASALAKVMPIRVHDGQDYAEVYFADGSTHSTQAMTMNPQDWLDLQAAYEALPAAPSGGE